VQADCSCSFLEISHLRIERAFESGPRGAAFDVRCQTPVAGDDVGVLQDAQDCRHHKIAGREAIAIETRSAKPLNASRTQPNPPP
jgi:hypothetical protein